VLRPSQQVLDDAQLVNDDCVLRQTDAFERCDPFPNSGADSGHGLTRSEFSTGHWHGINFRLASMPLPRKLTLDEPSRLFEMAERGGYCMNLEGRQAIERAVEIGRGGIWLELTEEQYRNLTKR
jgi:hypothetical protein